MATDKSLIKIGPHSPEISELEVELFSPEGGFGKPFTLEGARL